MIFKKQTGPAVSGKLSNFIYKMKIECIIGGVELSLKEVEEIYKNGLYIVTYGGVWQVNYSVAQRKYYGHMVVIEKGIASPGRYYTMTGKAINKILGKEILN